MSEALLEHDAAPETAPAAGPAESFVARIDPAPGVRVLDRCDTRFFAGLAGHPCASLFSSPPWLRALARAYGLEIGASVLVRDGCVRAAIPFAEIDDLRGRRVVSVPFSDYCDPLVEDAADWERLVEPVLALGAPVRLRCLRNELPGRDPRFQRSVTARWHAVDLARPEAEMWARLDGSARQNVRKAERRGVVVREGRSLDDVRLFHGLHRHVRKAKYRMLAQPLAFFEALHAAFAPDDRVLVLLAELDGVAVAGILFLIWGDTLYYKFNASTDLDCRPNDLLAWRGMRLGRERGLARLDFGISDDDQPGLIRYKRKFATEERPLVQLRWVPPGWADPRGEEAGRMLHRLTRLLTEPSVPDEVTRAAGAELYRLFA